MTDPLASRRPKLLQQDFTAQEFVARRNRVFDRISPDACVVMKGAPERLSPGGFRQTNEFYYLTGCEVPHAYLLMDARTRSTTLYVPERSDKNERVDGPMLGLQDGDLLQTSTGVDRLALPGQLKSDIKAFSHLYTQVTPPEGSGICGDTHRGVAVHAEADPLQHHSILSDSFIATLRDLCPGCTIDDVFPILTELRIVKSPAEVAVMREAGLLTALASDEAMRSTRAGRFEYELSAIADYIYAVNGSFGAGYDAIVAGGINIWHFHYKKKNGMLNDGDMLIYDYAPDLRYYTSDIGRMWPVNGTFTDEQAMYVQYMLDYHKLLETLIKPGLTADAIEADAAAIMEKKLDAMTFSDPEVEKGFRQTLETRHLTHGVGMAVHDTGKYRNKPLEPGVAIALDPQLWVPEQEIYYRIEDTVIVTETGIENVTGSAVSELNEIEAMIKEDGLIDRYPSQSEKQ